MEFVFVFVCVTVITKWTFLVHEHADTEDKWSSVESTLLGSFKGIQKRCFSKKGQNNCLSWIIPTFPLWMQPPILFPSNNASACQKIDRSLLNIHVTRHSPVDAWHYPELILPLNFYLQMYITAQFSFNNQSVWYLYICDIKLILCNYKLTMVYQRFQVLSAR